MAVIQVRKKQVLLITVTAFWLVMMWLFIQREFFQLTPIRTPYEVLPILQTELREEYKGIYLGENLIGFLMTALERKEPEAGMPPGTAYKLRQNTYTAFLLLGHEREMLIRSKAFLNDRLEMLSFDVKLTTGDHWTEMTGQIEGGQLKILIQDNHGTPEKRTLPVKSPLFFSESLSMIWTPENLRPGRRGRFNVWNPLLLNFEDIEFSVGRKTSLTHENEKKEVYLVTLTQQGVETRYWISPEGVVLRHESPTGLLMVRQEAWKIFDGLREGRSRLPDLPNLYSIPAGRELEAPEKLVYLRAKITSPEGKKEVTLTKKNLDDFRDYPRPVPADDNLAPFLESTPYIQAASPAISETAAKIAGSDASVVEASLKLARWVHEWINPLPSASFPSALQVLEQREGDCNQYTVLFTALARSLGIPVKPVAGLVYQQGRFFYHAWPEVYAGQWIPLDPTFNQAPAGVTHIPLAEGDLEEQAALVRQLGKINVEILEAY